MKTFVQKKNFAKREFKITDSKLYYNYSKIGEGNEIDIPYENIDGAKVSFKTSHGLLLYISITLFVVGIFTHIDSYSQEKPDHYLALFWLIIGVILLGIFFFTKTDFWKIKLTNNNYIYVHKSIPSKEETDSFINELMNARNNFLKENYFFIDENLGYENQLHTLRWLKSMNAINKLEFDEKYDELKHTVKPDKTSIGFGKNK